MFLFSCFYFFGVQKIHACSIQIRGPLQDSEQGGGVKARRCSLLSKEGQDQTTPNVRQELGEFLHGHSFPFLYLTLTVFMLAFGPNSLYSTPK